MHITRVQRWVGSTLILTVAFVWTLGMTLGALYTIEQSRQGAQVGIFVMAAIINLIAMVGVRMLNELSWITPWLLVALIPSVFGVGVLSMR